MWKQKDEKNGRGDDAELDSCHEVLMLNGSLGKLPLFVSLSAPKGFVRMSRTLMCP